MDAQQTSASSGARWSGQRRPPAVVATVMVGALLAVTATGCADDATPTISETASPTPQATETSPTETSVPEVIVTPTASLEVDADRATIRFADGDVDVSAAVPDGIRRIRAISPEAVVVQGGSSVYGSDGPVLLVQADGAITEIAGATARLVGEGVLPDGTVVALVIGDRRPSDAFDDLPAQEADLLAVSADGSTTIVEPGLVFYENGITSVVTRHGLSAEHGGGEGEEYVVLSDFGNPKSGHLVAMPDDLVLGAGGNHTLQGIALTGTAAAPVLVVVVQLQAELESGEVYDASGPLTEVLRFDALTDELISRETLIDDAEAGIFAVDLESGADGTLVVTTWRGAGWGDLLETTPEGTWQEYAIPFRSLIG